MVPGRGKKGFNAVDFIKNARHKSAPSPADESAAKMDESLYFIHMIKNGATVATGEHEALTRIFTGQKMYVDTRDISLAPHLMLDGVWEESFTKIFRRYLKPDSVFFDVGANFGYFGLVAGTEITSEGSIHFFEPNPLLAAYIKRTVSINGMWGRSKVVQKAVGASRAKLALTVPGDYFGSASMVIDEQVVAAFVDKKELRSFKVDQVSLDDYVEEAGLKKVDVMKIDVEGYEESVYRGMNQTIKKNPDLVVFLEFTAGSYKDPKGFFKQIKRDFKNVYLCDEVLKPVETISDLDETIKKDGFAMIAFSNINL
ncbi:MAG TPA: FkbM family methyltransferase [Candidatus Saccharimonadales bacterium]|nr:FkbM family methyltransferase [Candidatus Saccharimonadales bacterium]